MSEAYLRLREILIHHSGLISGKVKLRLTIDMRINVEHYKKENELL